MMQTGCKAWQEINFSCKPLLCFQDPDQLRLYWRTARLPLALLKYSQQKDGHGKTAPVHADKFPSSLQPQPFHHGCQQWVCRCKPATGARAAFSKLLLLTVTGLGIPAA